MPLLKTLKIDKITAVIDTREQNPLDLSPMPSIEGTLSTGDYSLLHYEQDVAIERKSIQDLVMCIGRERERFNREMQRLLAYRHRGMVIEGSESTIRLKQYRGEVHPNAVLGSIRGWRIMGIPVTFCENRTYAAEEISGQLRIAAQRFWNKAYPFFLSQLEGVNSESLAKIYESDCAGGVKGWPKEVMQQDEKPDGEGWLCMTPDEYEAHCRPLRHVMETRHLYDSPEPAPSAVKKEEEEPKVESKPKAKKGK